MLPQQPCTEAVHRLDVRLIHPEHLLPQVTVLRVLCHPLRQLCGQLCPQFGGSGAGKCDNKEIVYVAVFLHQISEHTLYQHLRLAGSGACHDEYRPFHRLDRLPLPGI